MSAVLGYVEVCLSLLESGVPEKLLKAVNASAVLEIPGREGVPKQVRVESFDSAFAFELPKHILQRVPGERLTFSGLKESPRGRHDGKVRLEVLQGSHSKGNGALLASFSGNYEVSLREMQVGDLGGNDLIQTQSCVKHKGKDYPVA